MKHFISVFIVLLTAVGFSFYNEGRFNDLRAEINSQVHKVGASQTISSLTELTSPSNNDVFAVVDTANTQTKKMKWGTATSSMKTIFDALYSPLFSTSAGFAALVSDELGTGKIVFSTSTILETPRVNVGSDATGDILYRAAGGALTRLGICSASQAIGASGGVPACITVVTFPYNASSTFNATTTIAADSLTNRALVLNGLAYSFPTSRGNQTNQFLTDNGTGALTYASTSGVIYSTTTRADFSGAGTTFATIPVAANTLGKTNAIHGWFYVNWRTNSVTAKSLTLKYNGASCATVSATPGATTLRDFEGIIEFDVKAAGATNSQVCAVSFKGDIDEFNVGGTTANVSMEAQGTGSVDSTASANITMEYTQNASSEGLTVYYGYAVAYK